MAPLARRLLEPANLLSLVRIPLGALAWVRADSATFVLVLLAVAGLTDLLDGWVARALARRHGEAKANTGDLGAWLDPVCDKLFVVNVVLAILVEHRPPVWVVALLLSRDVLSAVAFAAFALRYGLGLAARVDYRAVLLGKLTTVLQFAAVIAVLYLPAATAALAVITAVTGTVAIAQVSARAWREVVRAEPAG